MDYSKLTNAELDRLIAERRGWFICKCDSCVAHNYHIWINAEHGDESLEDCPSFTTDPRYAMELLEEMAEQHCFGGISFTKKWKLDYKACHNKSVFADTPERAIAEAYAEWREK